MPEQKGKTRPVKRRRVRFADDPEPVSKMGDPKSSSKLSQRHSEDPKWETAPADASKTSLLQDASINHDVTKFDLKEELREGQLCGEDGIVPNSLVIDDGSSSSGDETIPKKKRRRESDEDEDKDSDDGDDSKTPNLPDAIVEVVSTLQPGQTPANMKTPAAHVIASSNLCDRKRENLVGLISKWSLCWGAPGSRIHGPFTTSEMMKWARARYFCQPNRVGFVRPFGGCKWAHARDVFKSDQNE